MNAGQFYGLKWLYKGMGVMQHLPPSTKPQIKCIGKLNGLRANKRNLVVETAKNISNIMPPVKNSKQPKSFPQ